MKSRRNGNKRGEIEMLEPKFYKDIENMLYDFFERTGIILSPSYRDVFKLANKMGFDVRTAKIKDLGNKKVEGVLFVDETRDRIDNFATSKGIALNYLNDKVTNRFIVAHELSHYILQKYAQDDFNEPVVLQEARTAHVFEKERSVFEQIVDYMAAAILIPANDFILKLHAAERRNEDRQEFIAEASDYYNVSPEAISKRMEEVRCL